MMKYYIPKAQEGIKTDTIQNTNQFLNTTQKELNKKTVETAEGKKYNLTQLLSAMAPGLGAILNYNKLPNWAKRPLPAKEYNAKTF